MDFIEIHGFHAFHGNPWISWKSMDFMEIHGINGFPWTMPRPAEAYYEGGGAEGADNPPCSWGGGILSPESWVLRSDF